MTIKLYRLEPDRRVLQLCARMCVCVCVCVRVLYLYVCVCVLVREALSLLGLLYQSLEINFNNPLAINQSFHLLTL